jgi:hypothetical protein
MKQYEDCGLNMLLDHAQWEDGTTSVEAGVHAMLDRMKGGLWKVLSPQGRFAGEGG